MSTKDLFDKNNTILTKSDSDKISEELESFEVIKEEVAKRSKIRPPIDYSKPGNFAKYGSASKYYEDSFSHIYKTYPYDGSATEIQRWLNETTDLDIWLLQNAYPLSVGHLRLGGSQDVRVKGAVNSTPGVSEGDPEELSKQYPTKQGRSNIWDPTIYRNSNIYVDGSLGNTVEFWAKYDAPALSFDIQPFTVANQNGEKFYVKWNAATGLDIFYKDDGGDGVDTTINTAGVYNSFFESSWNHYAFSFRNTETSVKVEIYKNGKMVDSTTSGTPHTAFSELGVKLRINGNTSDQVRSEGMYIDEFRFWKTRRTEQDIGRHWFCSVAGGTNTDDDKYNENNKNVDLGIYYKFNEGITGDEDVDSIALDYSGRISNGQITDYQQSSRKLTSAIDESLHTDGREKPDPILYPSHPKYIETLSALQAEAIRHDMTNNSSIYHTLPGWVTDEDSVKGENIKELTQVLSSFFDDFHLKTQHLTGLADKRYFSLTSDTDKPSYISRIALSSLGMSVPDILTESSLIEDILSRSEQYSFEESIEDIKNTIYQNIYNNLSYIYKSKGTEKSFRNLIRCFGIDDEIVRLNVYANNADYTVESGTSSKRTTAEKKNYVDFSHPTRDQGYIESTQDSNNAGTTQSYINGAGSNWRNLAFTFETEVMFPKPVNPQSPAYSDPLWTSESIALVGKYDGTAQNPYDAAFFTIKAEKELNIFSKNVKFVLSYDNQNYETPYFKDVYTNSKFNVCVRLKPQAEIPVPQDPAPATLPYNIELYVVRALGDSIEEEHLVEVPVNGFTGDILSDDKYIRLGKLVGSVDKSFKVSTTMAWYDYLTNEELQMHSFDSSNYGRKNPSARVYEHLLDTPITKTDTLALHWDFNGVSTSDANGEFIVDDLSEGYGTTDDRFAWFTDLVRPQVTGLGQDFNPNDDQVTNREYIYSSKYRNPGIIGSEDLVEVGTEDYEVYTRNTKPAFHFFAVEKSMYQIIDDDILNLFASIVEFSNLVGQPVNRYRMHYKSMAHFRQKYFETIKNVPSLEKYVEYYKWIDTSIGLMIRDLVPASSEFATDLRTMIESHVLERNKYWTKFPTLEMKQDPPEGQMRGINELTYNWDLGHAEPIALEVNLKAIRFPSNGDGVEITDDESMSFSDGAGGDLPFSISAWVKPDISQSGQIISRRDSTYQPNQAGEWILGHNQGKLYAIIYDDPGAGNFNTGNRLYVQQTNADAPALVDGVWQLLTFTYDGSGQIGDVMNPTGIKFYVNAVENTDFSSRQATNYGGIARFPNLQTVIGNSDNPTTNTFEDLIADTCLYNKELSEAEIGEIYNSGVVKDMNRFSAYDSIISWWKLGDDQDTTGAAGIRDYVGTNHGSMINTTEIVDSTGLETEQYVADQNLRCLWEKERASRTDPVVSTSGQSGLTSAVDTTRELIRGIATREVKGLAKVVERNGFFKEESKPVLRDTSNNTYEGGTYATRRLSKPYKFGIEKKASIRSGVNYPEIAKDPNTLIRTSTKITTGTSGVHLDGLGVNPQDCSAPKPIRKYKRTSKITIQDVASSFSLDGHHIFPNFGESKTDANAAMQNIHTDSYGDDAEIPIQGPFTDQWVGGNQHRHVDFTIQLDRPELYLNDSGTLRHPHEVNSSNPSARYTRGELAKRPVNVKNIKSSNQQVFSYNFENTSVGQLPEGWQQVDTSALSVQANNAGTNKALTFHNAKVAIPAQEAGLFEGAVTHYFGASISRTFTAPLTVSFRAYEGRQNPAGEYLADNLPEPHQSNFLYTQYSFDGVTWNNFGKRLDPAVAVWDLSQTITHRLFVSGEVYLRWVATSEASGDNDHWAIDDISVIPSLSHSRVLGNYSRDYEVVQTSGRRKNNRWFVQNNGDLSETTTDSPFVTGLADYELPDRGRHAHIFSERFSAPGDPLTLSRGFLDRVSEEYSVYNSINYRNLEDRVGHQEDLYTHSDLYQGSQGYAADTMGAASIHKVNRNAVYTPKGRSYDNSYVAHQIPRSNAQYGVDTAQDVSYLENFEQYPVGGLWTANDWSSSPTTTYIQEVSGRKCLTLSGNAQAIDTPPADPAIYHFGYLKSERQFDTVITVSFDVHEGVPINPTAGEDLYFQYKLADGDWTTAAVFAAGAGNNSNYLFDTNSSGQSIELDYGQTVENPLTFRWVSAMQQNFGVAELWALDNINISQKNFSQYGGEAYITNGLASYSDYQARGWRQTRVVENKQVIDQRKSNTISVLDRTRAGQLRSDKTTSHIEPCTVWHKPLKHEIFTAGATLFQTEINLLRSQDKLLNTVQLNFAFALGNQKITHTYSNNLEMFSNPNLSKRVDTANDTTQFFDNLVNQIKTGDIFYRKLVATEVVYPKRRHVGLAKVRTLPFFDSYKMFWRDKRHDRIKKGAATTKLGFPISNYFRERFRQQYSIDVMDNFFNYQNEAYAEFNGTSSHIAVPISNFSTLSYPSGTPFSVSFWVNIHPDQGSTGNTETIMYKYSEWFVNVSATHLWFGIYGSGLANMSFPRGTAAANGEWCHVLFTYDGGLSAATGVKAYINGTEVSADTIPGNLTSGIAASNGDFYLGSGTTGQSAGTLSTKVKLHDVAIFNSEKLQSDAQAIYNKGGELKNVPGIDAHWRLAGNAEEQTNPSLNGIAGDVIFSSKSHRVLGDLTYMGRDREEQAIFSRKKDSSSVDVHTTVTGLEGLQDAEQLSDIVPLYASDVENRKAPIPTVQIAARNVKESQGWLNIKVEEGKTPTTLYEDHAEVGIRAAQNYAVLSEYCVSEHLTKYVKDNGGNFLAKNYDFLTLRGASYDGDAHTMTSSKVRASETVTGYTLNTRGNQIVSFPTTPTTTNGMDNCAPGYLGFNNGYAPSGGSTFGLDNGITTTLEIVAKDEISPYFPPINGTNAVGKFNVNLQDNDYIIFDIDKFHGESSSLRNTIRIIGGENLVDNANYLATISEYDSDGDGVDDSFNDATPFMMSIWAQPVQVEGDDQTSEGIWSFGTINPTHERGTLTWNGTNHVSTHIGEYSFSLLSKYTYLQGGFSEFNDFGITFVINKTTTQFFDSFTNDNTIAVWTFFHKNGEKAFLTEKQFNHVAFQFIPPRLRWGYTDPGGSLGPDHPTIIKVWLNGEELYGVSVGEFKSSNRQSRASNHEPIMAYPVVPIADFEINKDPAAVTYPWITNYGDWIFTNGGSAYENSVDSPGYSRWIRNIVVGNGNWWSTIVEEFGDPTDGPLQGESGEFNRKFRGLLDEFTLHQGIYTSADIQKLYNNGNPSNAQETQQSMTALAQNSQLEEYDFARRDGKLYDFAGTEGELPTDWTRVEAIGQHNAGANAGQEIGISQEYNGNQIFRFKGTVIPDDNFPEPPTALAVDRGYRAVELTHLSSVLDGESYFEISFRAIEAGAADATHYGLTNAPETNQDDNLYFQYSVNGGSWQTLETIVANSLGGANQGRHDLGDDSIFAYRFMTDEPEENHTIKFRWVAACHNNDASPNSGEGPDHWGIDEVNIGVISAQTSTNIYPFSDIVPGQMGNTTGTWKNISLAMPNFVDFSKNWSLVEDEFTGHFNREAEYTAERKLALWHRISVPFEESSAGCEDWDDEFFNAYVHADNVPFIEKAAAIQEASGVSDTRRRVKLKVSAIKKLLPYDGFYPQDRTVQIAKLFVEKLDADTYVQDHHQAHIHKNQSIQAILQHFFAPGILYNSLKAGIALDWACYTNDSGLEPAIRHDYMPLSDNRYLVKNRPAPSWYTGDYVNPLGHSSLDKEYDISDPIYGAQNPRGIYWLSRDDGQHEAVVEAIDQFVWQTFGVDLAILGGSLIDHRSETVIDLLNNSTTNQYLINAYGHIITKEPTRRLPFEALLDPVTHLQSGGAAENTYNNVPEFTLGSAPEYINAEVSSGKNHYFLMTPVAYNNNVGGFSMQSGFYSFKYERELVFQAFAFPPQPPTTTTSWVTRAYSQKHAFPYFDATSLNRNDPRYEMAMHNFLAEVPTFFLQNEAINVFTSGAERDFREMEANTRYAMDVVLRKSKANFSPVYSPDSRGCSYFGPPMLWKDRVESSDDAKYDSAYAAYAPTYLYGDAMARIEFTTPANGARVYSLSEILAGAQITYYDGHNRVFAGDMIDSGADESFDYTTSPAYKSRMSMAASMEFKGKTRDRAVIYDSFGNPMSVSDSADSTTNKWTIYPKFEAPILNYVSDVNAVDETNLLEFAKTGDEVTVPNSVYEYETSVVDKNSTNSYAFDNVAGTGLWSGVGTQTTNLGVFLNLKESYETGTVLEEVEGQEIKAGSLMDICGFEPEERQLGNIARFKTISESVVMIPFYDSEMHVMETDRQGNEIRTKMTTQVDDRHFIRVDKEVFEEQKDRHAKGLVYPGNPSYEFEDEKFVFSSITRMIDAMGKYNLPPRYDFLKNEGDPFVMYFFEFNHQLDKKDLQDIWQGIAPKFSNHAIKDEVEINHPINPHEFFGNYQEIPDNIRWMVFKVKKKAVTNYYETTADSTDDRRFTFDFTSRGNIKPEYSYNYPYDFFTMIDRVKVDATTVVEGDLEQQFRRKYPTGEIEE